MAMRPTHCRKGDAAKLGFALHSPRPSAHHWLNLDRDQINRAVYRALKRGGVYAVIDHSAREGAGGADAKALHRVEEKTLRAEIEKAGFRLRGEASFLRHAEDTRDWNAAPETPEESAKRRGTSDRFVLAFEKP